MVREATGLGVQDVKIDATQAYITLGMNGPGVYQIPYECGKTYIGQAGCTVALRCQEHTWHLRLGHTDLSAMVGKRAFTFHQVMILHRSSSWKERLVLESLDSSLKDNVLLEPF